MPAADDYLAAELEGYTEPDWLDDQPHNASDHVIGSVPADRSGWEHPVALTGSPLVPPFPVDTLPGWVAEQVAAVAEFTQTPPDLPGALALASLAAAAGGRAVVEVRGSWREPLNLFVAVAMAPGSRKSAVHAAMTEPLLAGEKILAEAAAPKITEASALAEIARLDAQAARQAASKAEGAERDDKVSEATEKALMAEAITVPALPRLVADDITPEAAASLLAEQGGRLAVLSAEGGIFSILGGRYTSGVPSLEVFLKGHAGDMLRIDRKGRPPEHVERPALTLGLTVQPDVLRSIARMPGFRGRGLLARILYSLPPSNVGYRRIGTAPVPESVADTYTANLRALVTTLAEWTDPAVLTLTPEAGALLLDAERRLEPRLAPGSDLAHLADWAGKLIGAVARIAGLLHLGAHPEDGWTRAIGAQVVSDAIALGDYFTEHALAAFEDMGADETTDNARSVLDWIKRHEFTNVSRRDVHAGNRSRFQKATDVDPVLELLCDRSWLRRRPDPEPGPQGGRPPSPVFDVNPYAHNAHMPHNPERGEFRE